MFIMKYLSNLVKYSFSSTIFALAKFLLQIQLNRLFSDIKDISTGFQDSVLLKHMFYLFDELKIYDKLCVKDVFIIQKTSQCLVKMHHIPENLAALFLLLLTSSSYLDLQLL